MAFNPNELSNEEYFRLERQMAAEAPSREEQLARAVSLAMKPRRASGVKRPRRSKTKSDDTVSQIDPSMILEAINAIESPSPSIAPDVSDNLAENVATALGVINSDNPSTYMDNMYAINQSLNNMSNENILRNRGNQTMSQKAMDAIAKDVPVEEPLISPLDFLGLGSLMPSLGKIIGKALGKKATSNAVPKPQSSWLDRVSEFERDYFNRYGRQMPEPPKMTPEDITKALYERYGRMF